jgi:hypothetical protein
MNSFRILELMTDHLPARMRFLTLIAHAILHRHRIFDTLRNPNLSECYLDDCDRCADEMR